MDLRTMSFIFLALILLATQSEAQNDTHCLDDVNACLPDFRARLVDNDHFWFGTPYSDQCPGGAFCILDRADLQSVLSRVLTTNDTATLQAAAANIGVLNVTFQRNAGTFYSCDRTYHVAADEPKTLDPLQPANLNQIHVQFQPSVTWTPRNDQTLYTFVLFDCSFMFLHTVFVNCPGGSLDGCEVARPWAGSGAGFLINSAYVYLVYEQTGRVPIAQAQTAIQDTSDEGASGANNQGGVFYLSSLIQRLSAYIDSNVRFASIMEMYPDPYGTSRLSNYFGFLDQCPLFYSQLPNFHSAVRGMQIPNPRWSSPGFSYSQVAVASYLDSINVNMHVTYETDDYMDTACCMPFQITRGTHMVSPLDPRPVRAAMTRQAPRVFLSPVFLGVPSPGSGRSIISAIPYTLLVVDATPSLAPEANGTAVTVHWLVANIFASDFHTGTEIVPYSAPTPTRGDGPIALMFLLFAHNTPVDTRTFAQLCPDTITRCQLKVTDLISTWNLGEIASVNWLLSEEDGFALKRRYTDLGGRQQDVCRGRGGYGSPCPTASQQPCSAIGQIGFSHPYLIGQLAALVLVLNYFRS